MKVISRGFSGGAAIAGFVFAAMAGSASAAVSLDWNPNASITSTGNIVSVSLYAISDGNPTPNQMISSIDMILNWDPAVLQLLGVTNNGTYAWGSSTFPPDGGLDGLNTTWSDGNAFYRALGQLGSPATATPTPGLKVTTFNFLALAETPSTLVTIPAHAGNFTHTRIQDGATAGLFVQTPPPWGTVKISIIPEPATLVLLGGAIAAGLRRRSR